MFRATKLRVTNSFRVADRIRETRVGGKQHRLTESLQNCCGVRLQRNRRFYFSVSSFDTRPFVRQTRGCCNERAYLRDANGSRVEWIDRILRVVRSILPHGFRTWKTERRRSSKFRYDCTRSCVTQTSLLNIQ